MKLLDLVDDVRRIIEDEKKEIAKEILKERILEIQAMKKVLTKAEKQLNELLGKEIDDVVDV